MSSVNKSFDAVGFMRAARDRMSREMSGMTSQEQIDYIRRKSAALAGKHEHATPPEPVVVSDKPRQP